MAEYKILITGPSWIGDMVMSQSLYKLLKQQIPEAIIDVLAPQWTLPVLERMPEVRQGILFPARHGKLDLSMRIKTGLKLRAECYDQAIIIPRSLKSALPSFIAGIQKRTGLKAHLGLVNQVKSFSKSRNELFVRRYLSLGSDRAYSMEFDEIPKPALYIDVSNRELLLEKFKLEENQFVIFAPGAEFGPAKQWPAEHFARLAELLESNDLKVCIVGSDKDKVISQNIVSLTLSKNISDLCGKTGLTDVLDLMSAAKNVVTNDSGLMHLACASHAKVISLFGSTSPEYTPPLADKALSKVVKVDINCSPCFARICKFDHYHCLTQIQAADVFMEVNER